MVVTSYDGGTVVTSYDVFLHCPYLRRRFFLLLRHAAHEENHLRYWIERRDPVCTSAFNFPSLHFTQFRNGKKKADTYHAHELEDDSLRRNGVASRPASHPIMLAEEDDHDDGAEAMLQPQGLRKELCEKGEEEEQAPRSLLGDLRRRGPGRDDSPHRGRG